jgi:hypothetical protein
VTHGDPAGEASESQSHATLLLVAVNPFAFLDEILELLLSTDGGGLAAFPWIIAAHVFATLSRVSTLPPTVSA